MGGHTQNANESFNSTVWRLTPKHLHAGLKIIEIAGTFNKGYNSILRIVKKLEITIGKQAIIYATQVDECRVQRQEQRSYLSTKEARKARKEQLAEQNEFYEEAEGLMCGAGIAD